MKETRKVVDKPFTLIDFVLEGNILKVREVKGIRMITRVYDPILQKVKQIATKRYNSKIKVLQTFDLKETTPKELRELRKNKIPYLVIKKDGILLMTEIPKELSFLTCNIMGKHKCASKEQTCQRLLALPDEQGGCKKVREGCRRIERYDFIEGFETFGTVQDTFAVTNCENCIW